MNDGALMVSSEFQQMCSNGVQAVMVREASVGFECVQQFQPFVAPCTIATTIA